MTAEAWAEELIRKHGMPRSEELYRALLELTFSHGKLEGGNDCAKALRDSFEKYDSQRAVA